MSTYLRVGLTFNESASIVRLSSDGKIIAVCASAIRLRNGDVDKVFETHPKDITGSLEDLVKTSVLTGDARRRRIEITFCKAPVLDAFEAMSPGGSWAVVRQARCGLNADFRTEMFPMDDQTWRARTDAAESVGSLATMLDSGLLEMEEELPTAWGLLYAASALLGGKAAASLVNLPAPLLQESLAGALEEELLFRQRSNKLRRLSPEDRERVRRNLTSPEQVKAFEALLSGKRK